MRDGIRVRVAHKWREAESACGIELRERDGAQLPPFAAGAHVDVLTPAGLVRQYSLCNAPPPMDAAGVDRYEICVLRAADSRGGSRAMHDALRVGDELIVGAPRNLFPLTDDAGLPVLVAGGIGITPIASMAQALAARGRPFELHYASRSRAHAALLDRLRTLCGERLVLYAADAAPARLDVDALVRRHAGGAHFHVCGPARLIDAVDRAAQAAGIAPGQVHSERFGGPAGAACAAGAADPAHVDANVDVGADAGFDLFLARSLRTVRAAPADTLLQALRRAGVALATSCEQGVCGTCLTPLIEGEVEHLDLFLSEAERRAGDVVVPCCSRARSRLVLDL